MKQFLICSVAAFVVFGLRPGSIVISQRVVTEVKGEIVVVEIKGEKSFSVQRSEIRRVKETIKRNSSAQEGAKKGALSRESLKRLVQQFRLNEKTDKNPQLAFGDDEISYWYRKNLDEASLKLEFAARRIILDAADKQKVTILDQEVLSSVAQEIIRLMKDESAVVKIPSNIPVCEGKNSAVVIAQAWEAHDSNNFDRALACTQVVIDKWTDDADDQQKERLQSGKCHVIPAPNDKDAYFSSYWALSDVAAALYIRGLVFSEQKNKKEATRVFTTVIERYNCAYTWDPTGPWFWSTTQGAKKELNKLNR